MSSKSEWWGQLWAAFTRSGPYSADWVQGRARGYREGYAVGVAEERKRWEDEIELRVTELNERSGHGEVPPDEAG